MEINMSLEKLVLQLKQEIVDEVLRSLKSDQTGEGLGAIERKTQADFNDRDVVVNALQEKVNGLALAHETAYRTLTGAVVTLDTLRDRVNQMASMQEQIDHQREQIQLLLSHVGYLTNRLSRVVVLDFEANRRGEQPPVSFEFTEGAVDKLRDLVASEVATGIEIHLENQPHHTRTMEALDVRREVVRALEIAASELRDLL